jgi:hypothetical protein
MSVRSSGEPYSSASNCSGAAYPGENSVTLPVSLSINRASPQSLTFGTAQPSPDDIKNTFAGLMSWWATLKRWA